MPRKDVKNTSKAESRKVVMVALLTVNGAAITHHQMVSLARRRCTFYLHRKLVPPESISFCSVITEHNRQSSVEGR